MPTKNPHAVGQTSTFGEAIQEHGFKEAARLLGRKGGSATSERKTAAVRENAKKGGWPNGKKRKARNELPVEP